MTPMTGDEANNLSRARFRTNRSRQAILATFSVLCFLILAGFMQVQQNGLRESNDRLSDYTHRMCEARKINTIKTNANWEALAAIERHNRFIDDRIRKERLNVYENAKLVIPDCG